MRNVCFVLLCFLGCLRGVSFDKQWEERQKIQFKIGGDITLTAEYYGDEEVEKVLWTMNDNTFLRTYKTDDPQFLNEQYKSRVSSHNVSSITISNATSEDVGKYTAYIFIRNKSTFSKAIVFYVGEHDEAVEPNGTTGSNRTHTATTPKVVEPKGATGSNRTHTTPSFGTGAIIGIVIGSLLVIIIVCIAFVYTKNCCKNTNNRGISNHLPISQDGNTSLEMNSLSNGCQQQHSFRNGTKYEPVPPEENTSEGRISPPNNSHHNEEGEDDRETDQ